jgi:hypothetical protein
LTGLSSAASAAGSALAAAANSAVGAWQALAGAIGAAVSAASSAATAVAGAASSAASAVAGIAGGGAKGVASGAKGLDASPSPFPRYTAPGGIGGGATNINFSPQIGVNGVSSFNATDFIRELRSHESEFANYLSSLTSRQNRFKYSD